MCHNYLLLLWFVIVFATTCICICVEICICIFVFHTLRKSIILILIYYCIWYILYLYLYRKWYLHHFDCECIVFVSKFVFAVAVLYSTLSASCSDLSLPPSIQCTSAQCPFTQPKICVNLYTLVSSSKCRASIQCTSAQCPFHKSAKPNNLKVTVHQTIFILSNKSPFALRNTLCILDTCQRRIKSCPVLLLCLKCL